MRNFLVRSFRFVVFFTLYFVIVNVLFLGIILQTDYDFKKRLESLRFNNPSFELLAVGASTTLDGIDTELLTNSGIISYNLGIGGASIRTNVIQISEYLEQYKTKPKFILLCVNAQLVKTFDENFIHPIIEVSMDGYKFSTKDIPIMKFKWLGFEFFKKIINKKQRQAKLSYGQLKFKKTNPDNTELQPRNLDIVEFESSYWIGEMAEICSLHKIDFYVLEMPGYKETQNQSEIGPYDLIFKNGCKAELYNFNSSKFCEIFDDNLDWIGNSHLNEKGAAKFTEQIINLFQ